MYLKHTYQCSYGRKPRTPAADVAYSILTTYISMQMCSAKNFYRRTLRNAPRKRWTLGQFKKAPLKGVLNEKKPSRPPFFEWNQSRTFLRTAWNMKLLTTQLCLPRVRGYESLQYKNICEFSRVQNLIFESGHLHRLATRSQNCKGSLLQRGFVSTTSAPPMRLEEIYKQQHCFADFCSFKLCFFS